MGEVWTGIALPVGSVRLKVGSRFTGPRGHGTPQLTHCASRGAVWSSQFKETFCADSGLIDHSKGSNTRRRMDLFMKRGPSAYRVDTPYEPKKLRVFALEPPQAPGSRIEQESAEEAEIGFLPLCPPRAPVQNPLVLFK